MRANRALEWACASIPLLLAIASVAQPGGGEFKPCRKSVVWSTWEYDSPVGCSNCAIWQECVLSDDRCDPGSTSFDCGPSIPVWVPCHVWNSGTCINNRCEPNSSNTVDNDPEHQSSRQVVTHPGPTPCDYEM